MINSDYNMLMNNDYMAGVLDWSNGESTGSTMVCSNRMGFPVNFPLNQSIEYSTASNAILY